MSALKGARELSPRTLKAEKAGQEQEVVALLLMRTVGKRGGLGSSLRLFT